MRAVSLIIAVVAILVAVGGAGAAYYVTNTKTVALENELSLLQDNLAQTKSELALAKAELAKADTSKLQQEMEELSGALWTKVGDLGKKDAELEAKIGEIAARPAPVAAPAVAGGLGNGDDPNAAPDAQGLEKIIRGVGKMFDGRQEQWTKRQVDRYKEQLNLTESQAEDLNKVMAEQGKKMMDSLGKAFEGGQDVDRRALFEQFTKERDEAIQAILTPEQYEKFKELEQNQMGRWGGMFGGGGRGRRGGDGQQNPEGSR